MRKRSMLKLLMLLILIAGALIYTNPDIQKLLPGDLLPGDFQLTLPSTTTPAQAEIVLPEVQPLDGNVKVHFIDIGQGDATLIQTPKENILIDAGNNGRGHIVWNYLKKRGINKVKYIIGSHEDADHIGGVDEVILHGLKFEAYISPQQPCDTKTCQSVTGLTVGKTKKVSRGELLETSIPIVVLNPVDPLEFTNKNDNSVVLLLKAGSVNILLGADCEEDCEHSILAAGTEINADIFKVGHHGSKTSSTPEFLEVVQAKHGIISVGEGNRYNHPHAEILERLEQENIQIYRTDLDGNVTINTDGRHFVIETS